jgi:hypothetical protein
MLDSRTTTWVDGDTIRLEITGIGSTTTLIVYQNGAQLGAAISDTGAALTGGKPGIFHSTGSGITVSTVNDWEGGGAQRWILGTH